MDQQNKQPMQEKVETKPPIKTNWKIFAVIAFVAIVLAVGGILILRTMEPAPSPVPAVQEILPPARSPQPLDTSDFTLSEVEGWQTYRNEEFGFEVRYPDGYSQYPVDVENVLLLVSQKDAQVWDIRIAWYAFDTEKKSIYEFMLMNSEYTKLGSLDALKLLPDTPPFNEVGYILIHNGKEFGLDVIAIDQKAMNDVYQILSTFRFVE